MCFAGKRADAGNLGFLRHRGVLRAGVSVGGNAWRNSRAIGESGNGVGGSATGVCGLVADSRGNGAIGAKRKIGDIIGSRAGELFRGSFFGASSSCGFRASFGGGIVADGGANKTLDFRRLCGMAGKKWSWRESET